MTFTQNFFTKLNQNLGLVVLVALCATVATTAIMDTPQWDNGQDQVEFVQFTN